MIAFSVLDSPAFRPLTAQLGQDGFLFYINPKVEFTGKTWTYLVPVSNMILLPVDCLV